MKILNIALLTSALTITPLLGHAEDFKPSSAITVLMPIVMDNLDTLHLTPAQLDQVRQISRKNFAEVEYINAQYHDLKSQVREATLDPEANPAEVRQWVKELASLDEKRMLLTVDCAFGLKKILTPEQFQELLNIQSFTAAK